MKFIIFILLITIYSCSSVLSYKSDKDIEKIKEITRFQFISYVKHNLYQNHVPKYLSRDFCKDIFGETPDLKLTITKAEASTCFAMLFRSEDIKNVNIPFTDIQAESALSNYAYLLISLGIITPEAPYIYGTYKKITGNELIKSVTKIKQLK